jgi:hypothetical protein
MSSWRRNSAELGSKPKFFNACRLEEFEVATGFIGMRRDVRSLFFLFKLV